jgi:predicted Zn-dependent protease
MANLATAERYYTFGVLPKAAVFAGRARQKLTKGSPDWERANDIITVAASQPRQQQSRD